MKRLYPALAALIAPVSLIAQTALYLHGDVADDGTTPSGEAAPFHQMRLNDKGPLGLSQFSQAIEETGITISEQADHTVTLNAAFLKDIDLLILGSNQKIFSQDEAKAVAEWVSNGGGLIAWSDSAFGGNYQKVGVANEAGRNSNNTLTEQFGMHFLTDNGGGNYLISEYTEPHFLNNNNPQGGVLFRGEGISAVRVSEPAKLLAKLQEGGLGGKLIVSEIDGKFNPTTDAALAVTELGKGRVIGVFDRNLFWNAGAGTRISHSDNREFSQRLALWACGIEDNSRVSNIQKNDNAAKNMPPVITLTATPTDQPRTFTIHAEVIDNDEDGEIPEVTWNDRRNAKSATFENNNRNTTTPTVTFSEPGNYRLFAQITDGEFNIKKSIVIKCP